MIRIYHRLLIKFASSKFVFKTSTEDNKNVTYSFEVTYDNDGKIKGVSLSRLRDGSEQLVFEQSYKGRVQLANGQEIVMQTSNRDNGRVYMGDGIDFRRNLERIAQRVDEFFAGRGKR